MQYPQVMSEELDFAKCIEVFNYHCNKYPHSFYQTDSFFMLACRGFYLNSQGKPGKNDLNLYDDIVIALNTKGSFYLATVGNTDPSFGGQNKAMLRAGVIRYYRGLHKGKYLAFRPYPEGVRLPCTRDGRPSDCANTNLHGGKDVADGIGYDTFSEGCITGPITFFKKTFRPECYDQIQNYHNTVDRKHVNNFYLEEKAAGKGTKHFPLILIEKRLDPADGKPKLYSATGEAL